MSPRLDKGACTVLLNKSDYLTKMKAIVKQKSKSAEMMKENYEIDWIKNFMSTALRRLKQRYTKDLSTFKRFGLRRPLFRACKDYTKRIKKGFFGDLFPTCAIL